MYKIIFKSPSTGGKWEFLKACIDDLKVCDAHYETKLEAEAIAKCWEDELTRIISEEYIETRVIEVKEETSCTK